MESYYVYPSKHALQLFLDQLMAPQSKGTSTLRLIIGIIYIIALIVLCLFFISVGGGIMVLIVAFSAAKIAVVMNILTSTDLVKGVVAILSYATLLLDLAFLALLIMLSAEYKNIYIYIEIGVFAVDSLILGYFVITGTDPCNFSGPSYSAYNFVPIQLTP